MSDMLVDAVKQFARYEQTITATTTDRDWLIRALHEEGYTMTRIAQAARLSIARVSQICKEGNST